MCVHIHAQVRFCTYVCVCVCVCLYCMSVCPCVCVCARPIAYIQIRGV